MPVILSVNTSYITVGFILSQCNPKDSNKCYYVCCRSITLNEHKVCFLQPKLEIYGLFHALHALKIHLIGVQNLVIEMDMQYIKGMLSNPDIAPSASINQWIITILAFHFILVHVPSIIHGPDGLS